MKKLGIGVFLLVVVGAMFATNLNQFGVADVRTVKFFGQVKVGDTVLPAGEYKVFHEMSGEDHIMFFRQQGVAKDKAASATVKCILKPLDAPARENFTKFRDDNGVQVLTLLQFKGDKAQHEF